MHMRQAAALQKIFCAFAMRTRAGIIGTGIAPVILRGATMLDRFMQQLSKDLEIEENLTTEVPNTYSLPLDENTRITISQTQQGISFICILGKEKKQQEEAFYTRLLLGNLFCQGTRGSGLGLSEDGNQLTLTHTLDYNVDYKEFRDTIEDFLN